MRDDPANPAARLEAAGRLAEAADALRQALDDAPRDDLRLHLARVLVLTGDDARDAAAPLLTELAALADRAVSLPARALQALATLYGGDVEGAYAQADAVVDAADAAPDASRAAGLHVRGMAWQARGDTEQGFADLRDAASQYRQLQDTVAHGRVLDTLGNFLTQRGRVADAEPYLVQSLAIKRACGDRAGQAITLGNLGRIRLAQGDVDGAEAYFEEDLELARALDDRRGMGTTLNHLGEVALERDDPQTASSRFREALDADASVLNHIFANLGLARTETADLEACRQRCETLRDLVRERVLGGAGLSLLASISFVEAEALAQAGRRADALVLLESAAETFRVRSVGPRLLDVRLRASRLYAEEGRTDEALEAAREVLLLLDDYGAEKRVREVERWISTFDRPALLTLLLRRYLPDAYVSSLLGSRSVSATSARRLVSVLFCDIRGFTAFAEATEPEEVTKTLNAWLKLATETVHRHGGVIDKFLGDGLMAHFGAFEDDGENGAGHARAAADAGAALQEAIAQLNEERSLTGRPTFRIGVGIATGHAVVGNVGSEAKMELTAIGRPVNLASRLEAATKEVGWPLIVCDRTRDLAGGHLETEVRTDLSIRGIGDVPVHLVRRSGGRTVTSSA